MITPTLKQSLTKLRLSGLSSSLDVRLIEAQTRDLTHIEFLELLIQDELDIRNQRSITRQRKSAGFQEPKTLDNFDFSFNTSIKKNLIFELATGKFLQNSEDILLIGPPGVGKSHLAQALGESVIRMHKTVLYKSIFDLLIELSTNEQNMENREKQLKKYLRCDLLIIDDMGIKELPKKAGETLFEIILRRHQLKSTLMTSNRPIDEWGKLLADVPAATAILDRFLSHCHVFQITGNSYRTKNLTCKNNNEN